MLRRKIRTKTVIRAQKELIRAQDVLIEWLLQLIDETRGKAGRTDSQQKLEVSDGHD